jgi:uncharacterized protein
VSLRYLSIREKARDFIESLRTGRAASAVGQKCNMDAPGHLAVDLQGKVMTCQNTGARGAHDLGHVAQLDAVRLDTATHWSLRECCWHCPVVQLCKGGCMYLEGEHFAQSCENEYRYNVAILDGILRQVTGLRLREITGDIRRPSQRRTIPISVADQRPNARRASTPTSAANTITTPSPAVNERACAMNPISGGPTIMPK